MVLVNRRKWRPGDGENGFQGEKKVKVHVCEDRVVVVVFGIRDQNNQKIVIVGRVVEKKKKDWVFLVCKTFMMRPWYGRRGK